MLFWLIECISLNADGQICTNNPSVNQRGERSIDIGRQVIVPSAAFNCNGRIKNIAVSMWWGWFDELPLFQVWRPTSLTSNTYNKTTEIQLPAGIERGSFFFGTNYYFANTSLNRNDWVEFQSGDIIGYFQPSNPQRGIWSIQTSEYTSYTNTVTSPLTSIDTSNADVVSNSQPLIEVTFGKFMQFKLMEFDFQTACITNYV